MADRLKHKKSGFWFLAKAAFILLMALSFASQLPAQTQKTPETNRSGNSALQDALKKMLEQLANRANRPRQPDNRQNNPANNRPNGSPYTPPDQTNKNTNTRPANTVNGNKNTSGPNNAAGNNSAVNSGVGPAANNAANNALPDTNSNMQTPADNANNGSNGNSNTNIAAPANNINTNANTNIGSGTIIGSDTPPPGQWPYMLILIIAAVVTAGIFTFAGIRYALSRGGGPASPEAAAAIPAPEINIGLRPDADPKLEIAGGGDVPTLDTGIGLKFKFDPGKSYISES